MTAYPRYGDAKKMGIRDTGILKHIFFVVFTILFYCFVYCVSNVVKYSISYHRDFSLPWEEVY